jgi:hypothetical protein
MLAPMDPERSAQHRSLMRAALWRGVSRQPTAHVVWQLHLPISTGRQASSQGLLLQVADERGCRRDVVLTRRASGVSQWFARRDFAYRSNFRSRR